MGGSTQLLQPGVHADVVSWWQGTPDAISDGLEPDRLGCWAAGWKQDTTLHKETCDRASTTKTSNVCVGPAVRQQTIGT